MRKLVKSESGFSLIELMVVVGIIGILAAIAVPQFSKFQAKARQTEAKSGLAALYTSEKGFFTEYTNYTTDLKNVGFGLEGTRLRYDIGFPGVTSCTGYSVPGGMTEVSTNNVASGSNPSIAFAFSTKPSTTGVSGASCSTTAATFAGVAYGNPNSSATATNNSDVWTIDNTKSVANTTMGIL